MLAFSWRWVHCRRCTCDSLRPFSSRVPSCHFRAVWGPPLYLSSVQRAISKMRLASILCHHLLLLQLVQLAQMAMTNPHLGKDVETMGVLLGKAFHLRRSASFEDIPAAAAAATATVVPSLSSLSMRDALHLTTPPPPALDKGVYILEQTQPPSVIPAPVQSQPLVFTPSISPVSPPLQSPPLQQPPLLWQQQVPADAAAWTTIAPSMAAYSARRGVFPEQNTGYPHHPPGSSKYKYHDVLRREFEARES